MKDLKLVFYLLISILIIPTMTLAKPIINYNGIEISEEDYERFLLVYPHEYIMTMDQTKYEKLLNLDFDNIEVITKYIATTYNPSLNLTTERELSKAEYDNFVPSGLSSTNNGKPVRLNDGSTSYETTAKKISLLLIGGSQYNNVVLTATWKVLPNTRSFDVIGFRGFGFDFRNGSQSGDQIYTLNGVYHDITYSWNGTNINKQSNGYGISMNIVNSNITALQLITECDIEPTIEHPAIYASYQHAVSNLTLAQSQNYTLGIAGLGYVFVYPYNISQKYDGMSGLSITY